MEEVLIRWSSLDLKRFSFGHVFICLTEKDPKASRTSNRKAAGERSLSATRILPFWRPLKHPPSGGSES